jgi:GT2 family glycosyltransferase
MSPLVSIVIVNWNGLHWLKMCLPSLDKQQYKNIEILLVDNASTDASIAWTKKQYPKVRIFRNTKNLGFAGANNVGYRHAKGAYVLLLNNDTVVKPNFLTELVKKAQSSPDIGAVQSKLLLMDDTTRLDAAGAFLTPTGFLLHWGFGKKDHPKYDKTESMYTAKGAAVMFPKAVLKEVAIDNNIFDPDYFAYFEETDLCHRIWLTGKRVVYAPKSVILHKMGGTSTGMDNAFIQYHSFKNRIRTYLKNLEVRELVKLLPVHFVFCQVFSLVSLLKGKFALSLAIQRSIIWNIQEFPRTLLLRRHIARTMRKIADAQYLPRVMRYPSMRYFLALSSGQTSDEA